MYFKKKQDQIPLTNHAYVSVVSLLLMFIFLNLGLINSIIAQPEQSEYVNYCELIEWGKYYGELSLADSARLLTAKETKWFDDLNKQVYLNPNYYHHLQADEFSARYDFSLSNRQRFPAGVKYHASHTNPYFIFHIAKIIYRYNHVPIDDVVRKEQCAEEINRLLPGTKIWSDFCAWWRVNRDEAQILRSTEFDDFSLFMQCYYYDDFINPLAPKQTVIGPYIFCPNDTVEVTCFDEIKVKEPSAAYPCNMGGKIRTYLNTAKLPTYPGTENCSGTLYEYISEFLSACGRDTCVQVFRIQHDPPEIICPPNRTVTCARDIHPDTPQVKIACHIPYRIYTDTAVLNRGEADCPEAEYILRYHLVDSCGNETTCEQLFTIKNTGPSIRCQPDVTVDCYRDIKIVIPVINSSCGKLDTSWTGPVLVSGTDSCPGAIYEVRFEVVDNCQRKASCVQRFTIKNLPLSLTCKKDTIVHCKEDIVIDHLIAVSSCGEKIPAIYQGPILISGTSNCKGARYAMIYTVTDRCNRTATCRRIFTLDPPQPVVVCPPDRIINCGERVFDPAILPMLDSVCATQPSIFPGQPQLIQGTDNCPGAVYRIFFTVSDSCGFETVCRQTITIRDAPLQIACPPDKTVVCVDDIKPDIATVSDPCRFVVYMDDEKPLLTSGLPDCPGTEYSIKYLAWDDCERSDSCFQRITLIDSVLSINCPPDLTVQSLNEMVAGSPRVDIDCNRPYRIAVHGPYLKSGPPECPGSIYAIDYEVHDSCGRTDLCTQRFTFDPPPVSIDCPDDVTVACEDDIVIQPQHIPWFSTAEIPSRVDGPNLIQGMAGCDGAVYEIIYQYKLPCDSPFVCRQRITLQNQGPRLTCPPDQTITSLNDAFDQNLQVETDCQLNYVVRTQGPDLRTGISGQPGSTYDFVYVVTDDCNREERCTQTLTLIGLGNNPSGCPYPSDWFGVSRDLIENRSNRFQQDVEKFILTKTCEQITSLVESGINSFYQEWASERILGNEVGLATDIARRGNIQNVLSRIGDIQIAIKAIEAALFGSVTELRDILVPEVLGRMATYLAGNGTPAAVVSVLNDLGKFTEYLNREILISNLNTFANMAPNDPDFFDADHFLVQYAGLNELRQPGHNAFNRIRLAIYDYAQYRMNGYPLPPATEIWKSQQNLNAIRTVTRTMLDEVCELFHAKYRLKVLLDKLKAEQSMLERFQAVWRYFEAYDCLTNPDPVMPDCASLPNVTVRETSPGQYECDCLSPFRWSPDHRLCVKEEPCNIPNAVSIFRIDHYECDCLSGYEWNGNHTACVLEVPDCATQLANSEAVWNPNVNAYECQCISGYEYDPNTGQCEVKKPDCAAQLANSEAVWNPNVNAYECQCLIGFHFDASTGNCEPDLPDCNAVLEHSEAVWNPAINDYECQCVAGFTYDVNSGQCLPAPPDCSVFYANTTPVWDAADQDYKCDCIQGYVWKPNGSGCEPPTVVDCGAYPNTTLIFDPSTNDYLCDCIQGYKWNASGDGCVKKADPAQTIGIINTILSGLTNGAGTADNPVVQPQNQHQGQCNTKYGSGANAPEQYTFNMGISFGTVTINYDTYTIKDRIHVYAGGLKVLDTGCVGTSGSKSFQLNGSQIRVIVDPGCDPSNSTGTRWNFTVTCPQ